MKFAVLIELSRREIAFRYYRDDAERRFMPFSDTVETVPLAIFCQGNDVQIGAYAMREAAKRNPAAWGDVFEAVRQQGTFSYRGQTYNMDQLLFVAVRKYLIDFFEKTLVNAAGKFEANVSTMPLAFLFHADLNNEDRLFVAKSFRDGGFVNLKTLDLGTEIVKRLTASHELPAFRKFAIAVAAGGANLYASAIDIEKTVVVRTKNIEGKGVDPHVNYAAEKLWDSLGVATYVLVKEKEMGTLRQVAEAFLSSDELELDMPVVFSDGTERNVFITKAQVNELSVGIDRKIGADIISLMQQSGAKDNESVLVLYGSAATNKFFQKNLQGLGMPVYFDKDPFMEQTLEAILDGIISKRFNIGTTSQPLPQINPQKPLSVLEMNYVSRKLREVQYMNPSQAKFELDALSDHLRNIHPVPSDLQQYLDRINKTMESVKTRGRQQPNQERPSGKGNGSKIGSRPKGQDGGSSPQEKKAVTLSAADVSSFNAVIMKARSEAPDKAVEHLKELQQNIQVLNPSNMKTWKRRLKSELAMAEQRLARMPKPVKTSSKTMNSLKGAKATSNPPVSQAKATRVETIPRQPAKTLVTGAIGGLKNMANKVKESDLVKAQKLFSDTFRSTFKQGKDEAVGKLEELLEALHKMGIRKFDFQINSRIELLKKK